MLRLLVVISRRLVHPHTFDVVVAPAVADFHYESHPHRRQTLASCAGVWRAVAGAIVLETMQNGSEARCIRAIGLAVLLGIVQLAYATALLALGVGIGRPAPEGFSATAVAALQSAHSMLLIGAALLIAALVVAIAVHRPATTDTSAFDRLS